MLKKIHTTRIKIRDERKVPIGYFFFPNLKIFMADNEGFSLIKSNFNLKIGFIKNKKVFEKRYPALKQNLDVLEVLEN